MEKKVENKARSASLKREEVHEVTYSCGAVAAAVVVLHACDCCV